MLTAVFKRIKQASFAKTFTHNKYSFSTVTDKEKTIPNVNDEGEPGFLQMVEAFFDKAANHTDISKDRLDFYKKSESLVKLHLTLKRGTSIIT